VSFFYAAYCIAGLGLYVLSFSSFVLFLVVNRVLFVGRLFICGAAYVVWIQVLPKVKGYAIRQVTEKLSDGAQANRLVRVPNSEVAEWDGTHDEHGNPIERAVTPNATI